MISKDIDIFVPLFADAVPPASASGGDTNMMLFIFLPLLLLMYWFFMLRPQQKQEETHRKMMDSLDRNDRVYTVGGLIGMIHSIDKEKNEVVLKIDDSNGTKVRFLLSAIAGKVPKDTEKSG